MNQVRRPWTYIVPKFVINKVEKIEADFFRLLITRSWIKFASNYLKNKNTGIQRVKYL